MGRYRLAVFLSFFGALLVASNAWASSKETILHRFSGGTDGAFPSSGLLADGGGHLYGTTFLGGDPTTCSTYFVPGCGVAFELRLTSGGQWRERVLYAFKGGKDGIRPQGNLIFDSAGNLYGTTEWGGTGSCSTVGCGTVFELSPTRSGSWTETVLYNFQGESDGAFPNGLIFDGSGNLYGTTATGASGGSGEVYELSPPQKKGGAWTQKILFDFPSSETAPAPDLMFDANGNLYGSQYELFSCGSGCGNVFELKHVGSNWEYTDLYDFQGGGNGGQPMAGVIGDGQGHLFGTGTQGGNNWGIAFELSLSGSQWKETMVDNFCSHDNCADGADPAAGFAFGPTGNLYGATQGGGAGCQFPGCGVVFTLTQTNNRWKETVLHKFSGKPDGNAPFKKVLLDSKGNVYGTTAFGGTGKDTGFGTAFELTP
jgi:uncharacterized repeat protein (TIGR03803 family)